MLVRQWFCNHLLFVLFTLTPASDAISTSIAREGMPQSHNMDGL
jgi:hypothetical protein